MPFFTSGNAVTTSPMAKANCFGGRSHPGNELEEFENDRDRDHTVRLE